jgi:hypothetical protein
MIKDAEEEDDIEASEAGGGELVHIECQVFDFGADEFAGFEESIELDAIDGDDGSAAALAFEAEPAIPCADVEDAFSAQIVGKSEEAEAPAEVFDALKAGEDAAVGEVDRVIAKARFDAFGELLNAFFVAGVGRGDAEVHLPRYISPAGHEFSFDAEQGAH